MPAFTRTSRYFTFRSLMAKFIKDFPSQTCLAPASVFWLKFFSASHDPHHQSDLWQKVDEKWVRKERRRTTSYASSHILTCVGHRDDGDEVWADKKGNPTQRRRRSCPKSVSVFQPLLFLWALCCIPWAQALKLCTGSEGSYRWHFFPLGANSWYWGID